ncbi:hypothetical protein Tco_0296194 [Tanacetum coccineum]
MDGSDSALDGLLAHNVYNISLNLEHESLTSLLHILQILSLGLELCCSRLVPSCFVIFDLEPLSLSFDFVFHIEIFKSFLVLDELDSSDRHFNLYLMESGTFYTFSTSLIRKESRKLPTAMLSDVDTGHSSLQNTKEYHSECAGKITRIMRRTL